METTVSTLQHVWIGRPVKSPRQPLELAILVYDAPVPESKLAVWKSDGDRAAASIISGQLSKHGSRVYSLSTLGIGFYNVSVLIDGMSRPVDISERIVVLSDEELQLYMSDDDDSGDLYSRLLKAERANDVIKEIAEEASSPHLPVDGILCKTDGIIPEELMCWVLSSLLEEFQMLYAFGLRSVTIGVEGMEDLGLRRQFWTTKDEINIMVSGVMEDAPSPAAVHFFENDEMGLGAKLRCAPDIDVRISGHLSESFWYKVSITAPGRHFVDFAVGTEGPSEMDRFRQIALKRPLLRALELIKYSDEGSGSSMMFRLRSDQSNAARDELHNVIVEWFQPNPDGVLIMSEINTEEPIDTKIYSKPQHFIEHKLWFFQ